jgi:hypothetical protein
LSFVVLDTGISGQIASISVCESVFIFCREEVISQFIWVHDAWIELHIYLKFQSMARKNCLCVKFVTEGGVILDIINIIF